MDNEEYDENYLNKFVVENENGEVKEIDIQQQRHLLLDGSTFKCHVHEIDDTMFVVTDSYNDEEII